MTKKQLKRAIMTKQTKKKKVLKRVDLTTKMKALTPEITTKIKQKTSLMAKLPVKKTLKKKNYLMKKKAKMPTVKRTKLILQTITDRMES